MKKIFFSLVALAALAACSKSEVQYEQAGEIGFSPVATSLTKSVAGTSDNVFPTTQDLYIFANAQADDLSNSWPDAYFMNAKFVDGVRNPDKYEGDPARYWPNVKSLIFAGYSSAGNMADLAVGDNPPTMNFEDNILSITGYIQNNTLGLQLENNLEGVVTKVDNPGPNDLMWFAYDGKPYSKTFNQVVATMRHACSWITVQVIGDAVTGNNYKLNTLEINSLKHLGDAKCSTVTNNSTTTYKAEWDYTEYVDADGDYKSEYDTYTYDETLYHFNSGETFPIATIVDGQRTNDPKVFENTPNNMVVLPQVPTTIDVTYTYKAQDNAAPITEVVRNLPLRISNTDESNVWDTGKHYIYTITITATEILVSPKVDKWDDVVVDDIPAIPNR